MKLANKTIIITGAGSGIGRELTLQLLAKNVNIIGIDLNEKSLSETQSLAGDASIQFRPITLNITDKAKIDSLTQDMINYFGTVDGIINNAGIIQKFIPVNELNFTEIDMVMKVNFYGMLYLTKAILPHLLSRPEAHIVNISSMGGFVPFPAQTIYGAAKAAVKLLTEGLYAELKNTNVKVTVVHPGAIATNITTNSGLDTSNTESTKNQGRFALPASEAASRIIKAIEKNKYRVMVGKDAKILDFLYRLSPRMATNFIGKMMSKQIENIK